MSRDVQPVQRDRLLLALAFTVPAVPLIAALVARHDPRWVPDLDLALTELRVRDVGGPHTPLIGLPGRIGTFGREGSHPGPLGFYLLAPAYRLLGSTVWGLQTSTVLLHLAGAATTVGLVARRAGARVALATGVLLAILITALGPNVFTEPWNPHLPLLWWPAFLAAAWLALCGDALALPVLALAGAICAQSHLPYLGPVVLVTALATGVCLRWPDRASTARVGRCGAMAAVLLLVVWTPPLLDQVRHDPGNGEVLVDLFRHPEERAVGWVDGGRLALERLDLVQLARAVTDPGLLTEEAAPGASAWRGGTLLLLLAGAVLLTARRAPRDVRAALGLAAATVAALVVSVARIPGFPWGYLMLWGWAAALLVVSAAAAALSLLRGPRLAGRGPRSPVWAPIALLVVALGVGVWAAIAGSRAEPTNPVVSRTVLALLPDVLDHLEPHGRYLVGWDDPVHVGGHGYGLFLELEREGVDVAVDPSRAYGFGQHRSEADGPPVDHELVVVSGPRIDDWKARPDARQIASVDVRTPSERAAAARTEAALLAELDREGLDDLVPSVTGNVLGVGLDPRVSRKVRNLALQLDALGAPAAVFLVEGP